MNNLYTKIFKKLSLITKLYTVTHLWIIPDAGLWLKASNWRYFWVDWSVQILCIVFIQKCIQMMRYNYYYEHERHMKAFLDISDEVNCGFSMYPTCSLNSRAVQSDFIQCWHVLPVGTGGGLWAFRCAMQTVEGIASVMPTEERPGWGPQF